MERYPDVLPPPLLREGAYQQVNNLLLDEMAGGNFKSRRRWLGPLPTIKEYVWRMRPAQAALFEGWFEHVLGGVSKPFEMNVATPVAGITPHECCFLTDPRDQASQLSQLLWEYRARVAIKRRAMMDEDTTIAAYFEPYDLEELVARLRTAVIGYLE